jgi:hypothetical protein
MKPEAQEQNIKCVVCVCCVRRFVQCLCQSLCQHAYICVQSWSRGPEKKNEVKNRPSSRFEASCSTRDVRTRLEDTDSYFRIIRNECLRGRALRFLSWLQCQPAQVYITLSVFLRGSSESMRCLPLL